MYARHKRDKHEIKFHIEIKVKLPYRKKIKYIKVTVKHLYHILFLGFRSETGNSILYSCLSKIVNSHGSATIILITLLTYIIKMILWNDSRLK